MRLDTVSRTEMIHKCRAAYIVMPKFYKFRRRKDCDVLKDLLFFLNPLAAVLQPKPLSNVFQCYVRHG